MNQQQIQQKIRDIGTRIRADKDAVTAEIDALKAKVTAGDDLDVDADFADLEDAVKGMDETAGLAHQTATQVPATPAGGAVPADVSGTSATPGATTTPQDATPAPTPSTDTATDGGQTATGTGVLVSDNQ